MAYEVDSYKQKDLEEKILALRIIENEFPKMAKLHELLAHDPAKFRSVYSSELCKAVSKQLDIPTSGITVLGGKPYVNKTGLTAKVQKDPRKVIEIKAIPVLFPMHIKMLNVPTDPDFAKNFIGNSDDGSAVYLGVVRFEDGSCFSDTGSANAKTVKMGTMKPYIMELAATRATNRAMRLATGIGLVSAEELNERGFSKKEEPTETMTDEKKMLIARVQELYDKLNLNNATMLMLNNKFGACPDVQMMKQSHLKDLEQELKTRVSKNKKAKEVKSGKKKTVKKASPKKSPTSKKVKKEITHKL